MQLAWIDDHIQEFTRIVVRNAYVFGIALVARCTYSNALASSREARALRYCLVLLSIAQHCSAIAQRQASQHALGNHGVGDLDEACGVGTEHQVTLVTVFLGGGQGVGDDFFHDGLELGVDLFEGPRQAVAVLAHLQAGDGHATGVGSLGRAVQPAGRHS